MPKLKALRKFLIGEKPKRDKSTPKVVPFTSSELPYIKHHGLRALCGLLMDRKSSCTRGPFCGPRSTDGIEQFIVRVEGQIDAETCEPLVALYFCKTELLPLVGDEEGTLVEWASRMTYAEDVPSRKAVVQLLDDGTYIARLGEIANPTAGDYSTGMLDTTKPLLQYFCNPEPSHTRWTYFENELTPGQRVVPEFLCIRGKDWWIVDRDLERDLLEHVAGLTVADNPNHPGDNDVVILPVDKHGRIIMPDGGRGALMKSPTGPDVWYG